MYEQPFKESQIDKKLWEELTEAWLKSVGIAATGYEEEFFRHRGRCDCHMFVDVTMTHEHSYHKKEKPMEDHITFGMFGGNWVSILIGGIDPHNPSFDPDEFFAPFKKLIEDETKQNEMAQLKLDILEMSDDNIFADR